MKHACLFCFLVEGISFALIAVQTNTSVKCLVWLIMWEQYLLWQDVTLMKSMKSLFAFLNVCVKKKYIKQCRKCRAGMSLKWCEFVGRGNVVKFICLYSVYGLHSHVLSSLMSYFELCAMQRYRLGLMSRLELCKCQISDTFSAHL